LKFLGYRKSKNIEFYTSLNRVEIDKNEMGYRDELFFDNSVDMEISRLKVGGNFNYRFSDKFLTRFSADIFPVSKLNIEQETILKPKFKSVGKNRSDSDLDTSFQLSLKLNYSFNENWKSELSYSYSYIPLKYSALNYKNGGFATENISEIDIERRLFLELITPFKVSNMGNLSIGIGREESGDNLFTIGFKSEL